MIQKIQDIGMINFERGGNIMEKVGVGVKKDLYKVSSIYVRLGRVADYHPSGLVHKSSMVAELNITGKKKGLKTIHKINKLTDRKKLEYILDQKIIRGVSRLSVQNIFGFSASELQDGDHIRIMYRISSKDRHKGPQSEGPTAVGGGQAVWKPTGDIVDITVKEIYLMENDFWFNLLGFDYD